MAKAASIGNNSRQGQSLLEMVIAVGLATAVVGGAVALIWLGQSLTLDAELHNQALAMARKNLESAATTGQNNFLGISSSSSTEDIFLKEILVQSVDAYTKKITSRVSWKTDPARPEKVELVTLVTDAIGVRRTGGDTGGGGLSGNWLNPQTLGTVDLGPGNSATGLDVVNKIVYLSADASDPKKPDFYVVDATVPTSPSIVSSINTGAGLNAVDVAGNYAYVASEDATQLMVINVSNHANPVLTASYRLPGTSGSGAASIFYSDSKVYIGLHQGSGAEFHIVDVTNPAAPIETGQLTVGGDVNGIGVSGNTAYLATSQDSKELIAVDVTDPAHPAEIGSLNATGSDDGESVFIYGSTLYLGRAAGSSDLMILNIANPATPAVLGTANLGGVSVNDITVRDTFAFVATSDSNKEFQIWNISNPVSPVIAGSYNFPQVATGIDYENNVVYVSVRSNDAMRIVTSQ
jgi:hypothetical protein